MIVTADVLERDVVGCTILHAIVIIRRCRWRLHRAIVVWDVELLHDTPFNHALLLPEIEQTMRSLEQLNRLLPCKLGDASSTLRNALLPSCHLDELFESSPGVLRGLHWPKFTSSV